MQHVNGRDLLCPPPKKKHSTIEKKTWLGNLGRPGLPHSSVPVITLWHLTWVKDSPGVKGESQILTKATFWGQEDASWKRGAPCPSLGSALKGLRGPVVGLCGFWTLPSEKATSSCQALGSRQENTPSHAFKLEAIPTKLRDKHHIWGPAQLLVQRKRSASSISYKSGLLRLRTVKLRHFSLSYRRSLFSICTAEWIKDNLKGSMSSFCTPIGGSAFSVTHHWIRNGLKVYLEKKHPLIGFSNP